MSLLEVTEDLGVAYRKWKDGEREKNAAKDEFFALADAAVIERGLQRQNVAFVIDEELPGSTIENLVARDFPRYRVIASDTDEETGELLAIIEEVPSYIAFTFFNTDDGMVYTRQLSAGATLLDDERMRHFEPALWEAITWTTPWGDPIVMPFAQIPANLLSRVQGYLYTGKPSVKLGAPRKAKPEELAEIHEGEDK